MSDVSKVSFRACAAADAEFLFEVYASTRAEELASVSWSLEEKAAFLRQQYAAQDHAYHTHYPGAEFLVICVEGADAGRLYLHRRAQEIRVMDVALLPAFRGQGWGTRILRGLMSEGATTASVVSIHVEIFNRARRLYERLGFREAGSSGVHRLMVWMPADRVP